MAHYSDELAEAERQGRDAHDAMEAWLSRPIDAPEVPAKVLEAHARTLRESRERLRRLHAQEGERDDIAAALTRNAEYHRALGLSVRGEPEPAAEDEAEAD